MALTNPEVRCPSQRDEEAVAGQHVVRVRRAVSRHLQERASGGAAEVCTVTEAVRRRQVPSLTNRYTTCTNLTS